ncbi:MAG: tetratricopeptide repeat protein [Chloroflexia bacterium]
MADPSAPNAPPSAISTAPQDRIAILPTGTVTFLFTDIEGSTRRWEEHPQAMKVDLVAHDQLVREAIEVNGGQVFKTIGDAFWAAFPTAPQALNAALAAQRALHSHKWGGGEDGIAPLRVRMALHTGVAEQRTGDYYGPIVDRGVRLLSAGHGGQILLSPTTQELVRDLLPGGVQIVDLGERRLIDLTHKEHIYQLLSADLPGEFPPLKTLEGSPNNLPVRPAPLIGREKEVHDCREMLRDPEVRLLTLTGPGGTGKTRLALQVAGELLLDFRDGVFAVGLAPVTDPNLVVTTIAVTLGVREAGGKQLLENLKDYLRDKHMLLYLDNFEQLLDSAPVVVELLLEAPQLKVLVTSREALRLSMEHEYSVPPLSLPDPKHLPPLEALSQYEAVALFVASAMSHKPDFQLTPENAAAVAEICVRLDGLPLAIELATARIKLLPPKTMLAKLGSLGQMKLLTGGSVDRPARQQTMRGAIEWSYDLLEPEEQALFRRLTVFVRGCTLESAEAVVNPGSRDRGQAVTPDPQPLAPLDIDVLDGISSLVNKSLTRQMPGYETDPRFSMLELIREFGLEQLQASGEAEGVKQQHARYFRDMAVQADPLLKGPGQEEWLERLETEHDNLRAAMSWLLERAEVEDGLLLAGSLWRFWYVRSYFSEGRRWLSAFLDLAGGSKPVRAKALNGAGNLAYSQADYDIAWKLHHESQTLSRELGDKQGLAASLNNLGIIARRRGEYAQARALLEEAIQTNRGLGNKHWQAINLNNLANVMHDQGDYTGARKLQEESLSLFSSLGDDWGMAMSLNDLGKIVFDQGDYPAAHALYERSLHLQEKLGDRRGIAAVLLSLGLIAHNQSDYAKAMELYHQSLAAFQDLGDKRGVADTLHNMGKVANRTGDYIEAERQFQESLAIRRELGDKRDIAESRNNLGLLALARGDYDHATSEFEESAAIWREMGNKAAIPTSLNNLGLVSMAKGEYAKAREYLEEGLATFRDVGDKLGVAFALLNMGLAVAGQGEYESAQSYYVESLGLFQELGDRLHLATCLVRMAALAAVSSPGQEGYTRAAILAGAGAAIFESIGAPLPPFERAHYSPAIAAARAHLSVNEPPDKRGQAFVAAWDKGHSMPEAGVVAYATGQEADT